MTQRIRYRIIAVLAIVLGLLSTREWGSILLGISTPAYHVFRWLVVYNVITGFVSLFAGAGIWLERVWGSVLVALILLSHGLVFLTIFFLFMFRAPIAPFSVIALLIRTSIWLIMYLLLRWAAYAKAQDA